jgi:hypothetical protein
VTTTKKQSPLPHLLRYTPSMFFVALTLAVEISMLLWFNPPGAQGALVQRLPEIQKSALETTVEMNKLVLSLASLVFGAAGVLSVSKERGVAAVPLPGRLLLVLTLASAGLSIYFSYVVYDKLVEMLSNNFLDLNASLVLIPRRLQIDSLGLAVFFLGLLFVTTLDGAARR